MWMSGLAVPGHWTTQSIKHVIRFSSGFAITAESIEGSGPFPVYGANGLRGYTESSTHSGAKLLVGRVGALCGNVHVVDGEYWASEHALVGTPRAGVSLHWLAHLLYAMNLGQYSQSTAQPVIAASAIERLRVEIPPFEEQLAIADYLDRETAQIDALIGKQERLIETLRERRWAVVERTIRALNDVWPTDKLGRHCRVGNGSTPSRDRSAYWHSGEVAWLNSAHVNREIVDSADQFVTKAAVEECHLPPVSPGSILVGLTGQGRTRGMATLLEIEATVSQHIAYVTPSAAWNARFLLWSLRANYEKLRHTSDQNGSTKGGLTCDDLKRLRVARPPVDEQRRIADYLDEQTTKIDALIAKAERLIELSKERRWALITAAVTGQIDVRTEVV